MSSIWGSSEPAETPGTFEPLGLSWPEREDGALVPEAEASTDEVTELGGIWGDAPSSLDAAFEDLASRPVAASTPPLTPPPAPVAPVVDDARIGRLEVQLAAAEDEARRAHAGQQAAAADATAWAEIAEARLRDVEDLTASAEAAALSAAATADALRAEVAALQAQLDAERADAAADVAGFEQREAQLEAELDAELARAAERVERYRQIADAAESLAAVRAERIEALLDRRAARGRVARTTV